MLAVVTAKSSSYGSVPSSSVELDRLTSGSSIRLTDVFGNGEISNQMWCLAAVTNSRRKCDSTQCAFDANGRMLSTGEILASYSIARTLGRAVLESSTCPTQHQTLMRTIHTKASSKSSTNTILHAKRPRASGIVYQGISPGRVHYVELW